MTPPEGLVRNQDTPMLDPKASATTTEWHHDTRFLCCRVDPRGTYVVAGGIDHQIQRWNVANGARTSLIGHENWVRSLAFSPDGTTLYSGGYDGRVIAWRIDEETPTPLSTTSAHRGWLRCLAVSSDGLRLATCGNDKAVRVWSIAETKGASPQLMFELQGHSHLPYSVEFAPNSHDLVSGDIIGTVHHWCGHEGCLVRTLDATEIHNLIGDIAPFGGVMSFAFSPDSSLLTVTGLHKTSNAPAGNRRGVALSFSWPSGEKLYKQESVAKELDSTMWRGLYHPSGTFVGALEKEIGFWNPGEADAFHLVTTPSDIFDCDFHPNRRDLYTAHFDGTVRCHQLAATS